MLLIYYELQPTVEKFHCSVAASNIHIGVSGKLKNFGKDLWAQTLWLPHTLISGAVLTLMPPQVDPHHATFGNWTEVKIMSSCQFDVFTGKNSVYVYNY